MRQSSDIGVGFKVVRREPAVLIADLAFRWSFGVGAMGLFLLTSRRVKDALVLGSAEQMQLASGDLMAASQALARTLYNSLPYLAQALVIFLPVAALLWTVATAAGRAVTTRLILARIQPWTPTAKVRWGAMLAVTFARVIVALLLLIGYTAATVAAAAAMQLGQTPNIFVGVFVFLAIFLVTLAVWSLVNFVVALAPIFVIRDRRPALDALVDAVALTRFASSRLVTVSMANAVARFGSALLLALAGFAVVVLARDLPTPVIGALTTVVIVVYCLASDWLLLARYGSYVAIACDYRQDAAAQPAPDNEVARA